MPGSHLAAPFGASAVVVRVSDPPGALPRHSVLRYDATADRWSRDDTATVAVEKALIDTTARIYVASPTQLVTVVGDQAQIFVTR
jgi:hypothetical protein